MKTKPKDENLMMTMRTADGRPWGKVTWGELEEMIRRGEWARREIEKADTRRRDGMEPKK